MGLFDAFKKALEVVGLSNLKGADNRTLTDLYNKATDIYNKAYDSVNDLLKISIERDNVGLATESTLSSIYDKLTQFKIAEQELSYDNSSGTATANYTVFTNDISIDFNGDIVIQIAINTATTVQLKLTPSGSNTSYTNYINLGNSLTANSWYEFEFNVNNGDAINFVVQVPAGATLLGYLRLFGRRR